MSGNSSTSDPPYGGADNLEVLTEAHVYNAFIRSLIRQFAPSRRPITVLDFGAGAGTFADTLRGEDTTVICVEPDERLRQRIVASGHLVARIEDVADNSVDYAYSLNVLEHIDDDVQAIRTLASKIKPDGSILVYVPAFEILWSSMDDKVGHCRRYTAKRLRMVMEAGGFRVKSLMYADSFGFFATLAYKLIGSSKGNINVRTVIIFDRVFFPLGRLLDISFAERIFGKNVYCHAEKL